MKKMLSLAAMLAVLSYASPASAELNISGDASVRVQDWITGNQATDNVDWQYRLHLKAAADLGDGYFFKALVTNESPGLDLAQVGGNAGNGGWQTVGYGNTEVYNLQLSNFYFGHMSQCNHYTIGRLPLDAANNPVFDLTLYPTQPLNTPVALLNLDRAYGANIGGKIGPGNFNATAVVLDNKVQGNTPYSGDGLMNDGYALLASYKFNIGNVTLDPEVLTVLTKSDVFGQAQSADGNFMGLLHEGFRPVTYGANISLPVSGVKLSASAFFTRGSSSANSVDYFGDFFRIKGESGPFTVWYDHNSTTDKSSGTSDVFTNNFVWAQYKINVHQSAKGSFSVEPTLRYLSSKVSNDNVTLADAHTLLPEIWATVTF
ncbi:MAG: hypothetical protein NT163_05585 [Chlorobiales bacterium]|nr:hypothetical protein [Chlorobiales bacterium]